MYDSFFIGASFALAARHGTFKVLRWPHTSSIFSKMKNRFNSSLSLSSEESYGPSSTSAGELESRKISRGRRLMSSTSSSGKMIVIMIFEAS